MNSDATIIKQLKSFEIFLIKLTHQDLWQYIIKYLTLQEFIKLRILNKSCKKLVQHECYKYLSILENQLQDCNALIQSYISTLSSSSPSILKVHKSHELKPQLQIITQNETSFKKPLLDMIKLPNPPIITQNILISLFYLTNNRNECQRIKDSLKWDSYKSALYDSKYKMALNNISLENIYGHSVDRIEGLLKDITIEQVIKTSRSLETIYKAVLMMKDYVKTNKDIENDKNAQFYMNILEEKEKASLRLSLFKMNYTKIITLKSLIPNSLTISILYCIFDFLTFREIMTFRQTNKKNNMLMTQITVSKLSYYDLRNKSIVKSIEIISKNLTNEENEAIENMVIRNRQAIHTIENIERNEICLLRTFCNPPLSTLAVIKAVTLLAERAGIFKSANFHWPGLLKDWYILSKLINLSFDVFTPSDISDYVSLLDGVTQERARMASLGSEMFLIWGNKVKEYVELKTMLIEKSKNYRDFIKLTNERVYLANEMKILSRLKIKLE